MEPAIATVAAAVNNGTASVCVPAASTPPLVKVGAVNVRKDLNALDEDELIVEIARVQNVLRAEEYCGPDTQALQVAALPVLNLPSHASQTGELQRKTFISEAKRVAEILAREESGAGRDLLKIIEDAELRPTTAQLDKALNIVRVLLQNSLDAFRGREPLYCVCRSAFIDSIASVRCQRCNDWFHDKCVGIAQDAPLPDSFICPFCSDSAFLPDAALVDAPVSFTTTLAKASRRGRHRRAVSAPVPSSPSNAAAASSVSQLLLLSDGEMKDAELSELVTEYVKARIELQNIAVELALCDAPAIIVSSGASDLQLDIDESIQIDDDKVPNGRELFSEMRRLIQLHNITYTDIARQSNVPGGRHTVSDYLRGRRSTPDPQKVAFLRRWLLKFREVAPKVDEAPTAINFIETSIPTGDALLQRVWAIMQANGISVAELGKQAGLMGGPTQLNKLLQGRSVPQKRLKEEMLRRWLQEHLRHQPQPIDWQTLLSPPPPPPAPSPRSVPAREIQEREAPKAVGGGGGRRRLRVEATGADAAGKSSESRISRKGRSRGRVSLPDQQPLPSTTKPSKPRPQPKPRPGRKPRAHPKPAPEPESEPEPESKPKSMRKSRSRPGPKPKPKPKGVRKTRSRLKPEPEPETDTEPEPKEEVKDRRRRKDIVSSEEAPARRARRRMPPAPTTTPTPSSPASVPAPSPTTADAAAQPVIKKRGRPSKLSKETTTKKPKVPTAPSNVDVEIGQHISCQDSRGHWYAAVVVKKKEDEVFVHFVGWKSRWDCWYKLDSDMISLKTRDDVIPSAASNRQRKKTAAASNRTLRTGESNHDVCVVCDKGGLLILCDGCPKAYHQRCLPSGSAKVLRQENWYCPKCTK